MSKELTEKLAKAAHGYTYEEVLNAAACIVLTVLRQKHQVLDAATEEADDVCTRIKRLLRTEHYNQDGVRKGVISIDPLQFPELASLQLN